LASGDGSNRAFEPIGAVGMKGAIKAAVFPGVGLTATV
jgi:hypothetical protein